MKLSVECRERLETFFREVRGLDVSLADIEVFSRGGARFVTYILGIRGITLGRFIFVNPGAASRDGNNRLCFSRELIAHEIAHTLQYRREGFTRFLFAYFGNYLRIFRKKRIWNLRSHFEAYFQIPHEIEAREFAENFLLWSKHRNARIPAESAD